MANRSISFPLTSEMSKSVLAYLISVPEQAIYLAQALSTMHSSIQKTSVAKKLHSKTIYYTIIAATSCMETIKVCRIQHMGCEGNKLVYTCMCSKRPSCLPCCQPRINSDICTTCYKHIQRYVFCDVFDNLRTKLRPSAENNVCPSLAVFRNLTVTVLTGCRQAQNIASDKEIAVGFRKAC